jgi:hypothetical protein
MSAGSCISDNVTLPDYLQEKMHYVVRVDLSHTGIFNYHRLSGPHESIFLKRRRMKINAGTVGLWETRI